ncbi:FecR domain-containing protein, partial [Chloroflexota bacterium]
MGINPAKVLEVCIERMRQGESVENCLAEYPEMWGEIEPLLSIAQSITALPKVSLSDKFKKTSKARLMRRIRQQSDQVKTSKSVPRMTLLDELATIWQNIWHPILGVKKVVILVTLTSVTILVITLSGVLNFSSPSQTLASKCTLSILSGNVDIQIPGEDRIQQGTDGATLTVGTRIRTSLDSHALLTFFEGSTIKLDPNTDVEIQQVVLTDEESTTIVLKQWLGRTWSRVIKMADPESHYRIETPSATAIVRGTLFATEVTDSGFTKVSTTEGLVSVVAQDKEIHLPANLQTCVETGAEPFQPEMIPDPKSEIIVTISKPATGSITDPTESSTGILPNGESYNQIPGSQSSSPSEMTQLINISEPVTGEYIITLRYLNEGIGRFSIQGKSEGKTIFRYTGKWDAANESGRIIHLNLNVDDGYIAGGEINVVEPLGDEPPEKGILSGLSNKRSTRGKSSATENDGPGDSVSDTDSAGKGKTSTDKNQGKGSTGDKKDDRLNDN